MTPEQKLDRLERIAKLFVRAGLRERSKTRELDEKIKILINAHVRNEDDLRETQRRNEEEILRFQIRTEDELREIRLRNEEELRKIQTRNEAELHKAQMRNEDQLRKMRGELDRRSSEIFELFRVTDEKIDRLTEAQTVFDHKLNALIERS